MKNSLIALAAAALLASMLPALPAQAEGEAKSAADFANWLGLGPIQAEAGATTKSRNSAVDAARLRTQRAAKAKAAQAAKAAEHGQVAASAQIVKTPPVAKTKAGPGLAAATSSLSPVSGQGPAPLDCRKYIPTAGMTISVACTE